jgi:hypothetical protein
LDHNSNENAKRNIQYAQQVWKSSSKFITIKEDKSATLQFLPELEEGVVVKDDTYMGELTGKKTFYKAVEVSSPNTEVRTFKANRRSSELINDQLMDGNTLLVITREGNGKDTVYRPSIPNRE